MMIRRFVAIVGAAVVSSAALQAQNATSGDPSVVAAIDAAAKAIDADSAHLTRTKRSLEDYSTEGGDLYGFFADTTLRMLSVISYGETGRVTERYYYLDHRLALVRSHLELYDHTEHRGVHVRVDRALYFADGKLIRVVRRQLPALRGEDFSGWDQRPPELQTMAREFAVCARPRHRPTCKAPSRGA
jgi:hypothetical protein